MHCKLLTMLVLIFCREFSERLTILVMLKKVMQFFINEDDGLVNIKNVYLICITILCVLSYTITGYLVNRHDDADQYIQELESAIEATGVDVAHVCSGDGYVEYHNK